MNCLRKGFTLVELLIVIVVIGVLSTMMMISSSEAVSSTKAAVIISNLTNLRIAVTSWYLEHSELLKIDPNDNYHFKGTTKAYGCTYTYKEHKSIHNLAKCPACRKEILKYLNNDDNIELNVDDDGWKEGHYRVFDLGANNINVKDDTKCYEWYVGYFVPNDARLKQKLASRAESIGLFEESGKYYENKNQVWLKVLDLR